MKYAVILLVGLTISFGTSVRAWAQDDGGWWEPKTPAVREDDGSGDRGRTDRRPRVIIGERDRGPDTRGRRGRETRDGRSGDGETRGRRGRDEEVRGRSERGRRSDEPRARRDRDDDYDDGYEGRRNRRGGKKGGPPFCRSGAGHPVHGMQWCYDKGFGGDRQYDQRRRSIGDIIFGTPRDRRTSRRGQINNETIGDILGDVVYGRLQEYRRQLGSRAPIEGRWLSTRERGRVLQLRAGSLPLAELTDYDGDDRVDVIWLNDDR